MQALYKSVLRNLYSIRVEVEEVKTFKKVSDKRDFIRNELERLSGRLFSSKVKALKLVHSQLLSGMVAISRNETRLASDFFEIALQFAVDSFTVSTNFSDRALSTRMRLLVVMAMHKNSKSGKVSSQEDLHNECTRVLDALLQTADVQTAIKRELETEKSSFAFSSNSFKTHNSKILVEVASITHFVEEQTEFTYTMPSTPTSSSKTQSNPVSMSSKKVSVRGHGNRVTCIASHSQYVFTGSKDNTIKVWSQDRVTLKATLRGHQNVVNCLQVVGDVLYSGSGDGTVKCWDINTLSEIGSSVAGEYSIRSLAVDKASDSVFIGCNDSVIRVLSVFSLLVKGSMKGHSAWVTSLAVRGSELYSASVDRSIKVWDIASFMCVHSFHGHSSYITSLVVAGNRLVSGSHDMTVRVWDLSTREEVSVIAPPGLVYGGKSEWIVRGLTATNNKLYIGYANDSVSVLSLSTLEVLQRIHTKPMSFDNCLAVSDGKMFVGSSGKSIHVHLL